MTSDKKAVRFDDENMINTIKSELPQAEETDESEPGKNCELAMYLENLIGLIRTRMAPMDRLLNLEKDMISLEQK